MRLTSNLASILAREMWKVPLSGRLQSRTRFGVLLDLNNSHRCRPPILAQPRVHVSRKRDASRFTKIPLNPAKANKSFYAFALGSIFSGALVYYLTAAQQNGHDTTSTVLATKSGLNEQYGTPEDFKRAIAELRSTFSNEDAVSTDADVLEVHGFSENDYHPGTFWISFVSSYVTVLIESPFTLH